MSFPSLHAPKIWNRLYTVLIPDHLTLNAEYVRRFGTHSTGNKRYDHMVSTNFTTVKIPIASILAYFEDGAEIQIPSREDMLQMHKDIELYLQEWKDHIKYDINSSLQEHKKMILSLEKLSKTLYEKARGRELVNTLFSKKDIGLVLNPLQRHLEATKPVEKPDYEGISKLVRSKNHKPLGRF